MPLIPFLKRIKRTFDPYQPLIEVKIFRQHILHNLRAFQTACPRVQFAPVLKSNAYGHGLTEVAGILSNEQLPFFMVDSLFEARSLRHHGIKKPVLVLGFTTADNIGSCRIDNVAFGITSLEQLRTIDAALKRPANFHLKIDTGMRRQGLAIDDLPEAMRIIKDNSLLRIEGLCSHLADADGNDDAFTQTQITLWNKTVENAERQLGPVPYKHLANTAGGAFAEKINANVMRLGIGLYGFNTSAAPLDLKPALQMESVISSVRRLKTGESVGYNRTFTAERDMQIATVPAGYAEGVDRRLSSLGCFTVGGIPCPIVGRVSMNVTSIDVSAVPHPRLEQPVTVISANDQDPNSIARMARAANTIPYDILVHIPPYLRRTVL